MAKVTKTQTVTIYNLELSQEEAEALRATVGHITGSLSNSRRKHTSAIYRALGDAGVNYKDEDLSGNLNFGADDNKPKYVFY